MLYCQSIFWLGGVSLRLYPFAITFVEDAMPKTPAQQREDEVLLRMLKTPPKPHAEMKGKAKASPKPPKARIPRHQGR